MSNKRKAVPSKLENELMQEAGWRCAIPACHATASLQIVHIIPYSECNNHTFENMIVLCANCHGQFDSKRVKTMTANSMRRIKDNLKILNGRYSPFEFRLLQYFLNNKEKREIFLHNKELDVMFLIKDGLLEESSKRYQNAINMPPKKYILTEAGAKFIERWETCHSIK